MLEPNAQGTATVSTQTSSDVIAAPGATKRLRLLKGTVSVSVFAASATVALDDGTTTIWKIDAAADENGGHFPLDFNGYYLGKNKALKLTVAGGNATAIATFTAHKSAG